MGETWELVKRPWEFFTEDGHRRQATKVPGSLSRQVGPSIQLACPFEPRREFPFPEFFCLGRVEKLLGRYYVVYTLDDRGYPIFQ